MRYNTGNPVEPDGSDSPFDLHDNSANFDVWANDRTKTSWPDRLGVSRKTWHGMEQQVTDYLIAQGYESVYLTYGPGVVVERQTQLVQRDGELYRVMNAADIPLTLSGTWATDAPKLQAVGDAALRQALANHIYGAGLVAFDPSIAYADGTVGAQLKYAQGLMPSVEQFGIIPDGVTDWESSSSADWAGLKAAALTTGVRWPAGKTYGEYYACGINFDESWSGAKMHFEPGSVLGGVFHLISGGAMVPYDITAASRSANVVTITTSSPHEFVTGSKVQVRSTYQPYTPGIVTLNTDGVVVTVTSATSFTYPQVGPDVVAVVTGSPLGKAQCNKAPVRDVVITGFLTTTDRLGTINCKDCYIEYCRVLNDPNRHSAAPGQPARGAHLYIGTDGLRVGNLIIDYAEGANTAAAFSLDGNGWNPSNCSIGRLHVKDSAYNGVYITGGGHYFGEIRVDGFAKGEPNGGDLQDSNGPVQTAQFKSFWTNRCWNTRVDTLFTNQRVQDGTRGYEYMHALIDQAGHPAYSTAERGVSIGRWEARNVRRQGIYIGDAPTFDSINLQCDIDSLQISAAGEGLSAGSYCLDIEGASGSCDVNIGTVRLAGTGNSLGIKVMPTATGAIGRIHAINHNNRILYLAGAMHIGLVKQLTTSGGVPTMPLIEIDGSGDFINGTCIEMIDLYTSVFKAATVLAATNSARKWRVGILRSRGYRSNAGTVIITNPNQGFTIDRFDLVGPDNTGVAVMFSSGTVANSYMGGRIQGFAKGLDKGAATFTASSNAAVSMSVSSTVTTDLPAASFDKLACTGVTL